MQLSDLLPVHSMPYAQTSVSPDCRWTLGDTEKDYRERGGHPFFDNKSISYILNEFGYRCPDFKDSSTLKLISIGCSYTYGVGLPRESLFHEIVAERLRKLLDVSIVNWNLSSGAVSNNYIARVLQLAVPILNPDFVMIFFTHAARREYVTANNEAIKYKPNKKATSLIERDIFRTHSLLSSRFDNQLSFFRDFKSIECLLRCHLWGFSMVDPDDFSDIVNHLSPMHRVPDYNREIFRDKRGIRDTARDHQHPGPRTHANIADCYWEWLLHSGALDRLKLVASQRPQNY